jgi:hypothetical protein
MDMEQYMAETATGCANAGGYRVWAEQQGYQHCEVWDWTSSAGDWTLLVSKDRETWYLMFQSNNWPRAGFTRTIDLDRPFSGAMEEVYEQVQLECS